MIRWVLVIFLALLLISWLTPLLQRLVADGKTFGQ